MTRVLPITPCLKESKSKTVNSYQKRPLKDKNLQNHLLKPLQNNQPKRRKQTNRSSKNKAIKKMACFQYPKLPIPLKIALSSMLLDKISALREKTRVKIRKNKMIFSLIKGIPTFKDPASS